MLWALLVIAAVYVLCLLKDGDDRKFKAQSFEFSLNRCLINPLLRTWDTLRTMSCFQGPRTGFAILYIPLRGV